MDALLWFISIYKVHLRTYIHTIVDTENYMITIKTFNLRSARAAAISMNFMSYCNKNESFVCFMNGEVKYFFM